MFHIYDNALITSAERFDAVGKAAAGPEAVQRLALDTLANVELGSLDRLLAFVHECVLPLLANAEALRVRRAAAQAATCVLQRYLGQHEGPKNGHASSKVSTSTLHPSFHAADVCARVRAAPAGQRRGSARETSGCASSYLHAAALPRTARRSKNGHASSKVSPWKAMKRNCILGQYAEAVRVRRAAVQAATCVLQRYLGQHEGPKKGHASSKASR